MFFILSKIFYFFLQPLVWVGILITLYFLIKNKKWKQRLKWSTLAILLIFSNPALLKISLYFWEIHAVQEDEINDNYELAVVLGGMAEWDNDVQRISCRRGIDRLWQSLDLYHQGKVDKILLSGASGYVVDRGLHEADMIKKSLEGFNYSSDDILTESKSRNTYENVLYTKTILDSLGLKKVLLVTSARHMRRAKAIFQKLNIECDIYPTDQYTGNELTIYWDEYFLPQGNTFAEWTDLIKEVIGYAVYDVKGYI